MATSGTYTDPLTVLRSLLHPNEIISPDSTDYLPNIQTWAAQKQANPSLVIRPTSVDTLRKSLVYLYNTNLDFAVYGHGFSSASSKDVLVNMSAFDDFHFDPQSESVTIGAGQTWANVYQMLDDVAPGYGSKTPPMNILLFRRSIQLTHYSRRGPYSMCRGCWHHPQWGLFVAFK